MALVIEDGTGVANAESYVTALEARAFALKRGITLDVDDAVVEPLLIQAMDWLEALRLRFIGSELEKSQQLAWPRYGVVIFGYLVDEDLIPPQLKNAQMQLCIDAQTTALQPTSAGKEVTKNKVGELEKQFAESGTGGDTTQFVKAQGFLRPLLNGINYDVVRV